MTIGAIILGLLATTGAIFVSTVARVLGEDAKTFIPRFTARLIRRAAARIHESSSNDFCEEWLAHLDERPELTGKLWHALSIYFWGAGRICRLVGFSTMRPRHYLKVKRVMDFSFVLVAMVIMVPLVALVVLIGLFYGQKRPFMRVSRIGKSGREIRLWRLQTLVPNAEEVLLTYLENNPDAKREWLETGKLRNDPRRTRYHAFLKRVSLDELPILLNVLNGDMSLVGPRAYLPGNEPADQSSKYYDMKPGITGLWQVSDPSDPNSADREQTDEVYHKRQSLIGDLKILKETVGMALWKNRK